MVTNGWSYLYLLFFVCAVFAERTPTSTAHSLTRRRRQSSTCVLPYHPYKGKWEILGGCGKPGQTVAPNTILLYKCDPDYKLNNTNPYAICNKGWQGNQPSCEKMCPAIYSTLTTTVSCKDKDGRKIGCDEATDGTYLTYTCAPYYEAPSRLKRAIFCYNGMWSSSKPVCHAVCGRRVDNDVLPIIAGGTPARTHEYPWVIALYMEKSRQYVYICGGTLINRRVVLTAAHCVADEQGNPLPARLFQVAAGKLYSPHKDERDVRAQYLGISTVITNPEYRGGIRRFLGDIAILVTKEMFELSPVVQPACFNGVNDISLQVGHTGEVAGWGNTETDRPSVIMKYLHVPYKSQEICEREFSREWADKYNLIDKMCAGLHNQSKSLCKGDSGSGLAFKHHEDNLFYVHGVASLSPMGPEGKCNVQQNTLYTKVAFYYDFIERLLAIYKEDDCRLPPYPENGKYIVEGRVRRPGEVVFSSDILRVWCNDGYTLDPSDHWRLTCESAVKMPKCELQEKITTNADSPCTDVGDSTPKSQPNNRNVPVLTRNKTIISGTNTDSECTDNNFFANCDLVVKARYCEHKHYAKYCCKSCRAAGLLPVWLAP